MKTTVKFCGLLILCTLFVAACSQSEIQGPNVNNTDCALQESLYELNTNLMNKLESPYTRGDQNKKDTTKVVLCDVRGAINGAAVGARLGVWGAIGGAIIMGAIDSYVGGYKVFEGGPGTVVAYDTLAVICDKVLAERMSSLNIDSIQNSQSGGINENSMIVGLIHNEVLDSIYAYERNEINLEGYSLQVISPALINRLRPFANAILNETDINTDFTSIADYSENSRNIMDSFATIFSSLAVSDNNTATIVQEYIMFIENNKSSIPQQEADALYQSMGVALSSYEYWTNKYGGTTNEE